MKKNHHEEKNGQIRTAGRPTPRAPPAQAERRRPRQILRARSSWNLLLPRERQSPISVSSMNESRTPPTGRAKHFPHEQSVNAALPHLDSRSHAPSPPLPLSLPDPQSKTNVKSRTL